MINEIWKDIPWYEWRYQASSFGNVRSLNFAKKRWVIKNISQYNWIYKTVSLWYRNVIMVHRLVAKTFIPNLENKKEVNHKDWNKHNNNLDNLEWCTRSENSSHSYRVLWNIPYKTPKWTTGKPVKQYDRKWNFIKKYPNITIASFETNVLKTNITHCLSWQRRTAWWFIWKLV